jgi:hypothetical protein
MISIKERRATNKVQEARLVKADVQNCGIKATSQSCGCERSDRSSVTAQASSRKDIEKHTRSEDRVENA